MIGVIIQVRTTSTRLPGKVLLKIKNYSILDYVINQVKSAKKFNMIVIATTNNKTDDVIIKLAQSKNIPYFRGDEDDVLDRYYQCAKNFNFKTIVRITSDNPLIDPDLIDKCIMIFKNNNYDYVSTEHPPSFPQGFAVEVFSFNSLEIAWKNSRKWSEREHVTPYFYNNPKKFNLYNFSNNTDLSHIRCTLDRKNDYEFIKEIITKIENRPIHIMDILDVIKNNPHLLKINENNVHNEGYLKSIQEEKDFFPKK